MYIYDLNLKGLRTINVGQITAASSAILVHDETLVIGDESGTISTWHLGGRASIVETI